MSESVVPRLRPQHLLASPPPSIPNPVRGPGLGVGGGGGRGVRLTGSDVEPGRNLGVDLDINVDGDMASAWVPYTFYFDGAVRHCGINSIELLRDADGWKVTQLSDTRRTENCPDPLGRR